MKNFLPVEYKKNNTLKLNHSYLVEQFSDYSKIFKEIEKVVKEGDYTLGKIVDECEGQRDRLALALGHTHSPALTPPSPPPPGRGATTKISLLYLRTSNTLSRETVTSSRRSQEDPGNR